MEFPEAQNLKFNPLVLHDEQWIFMQGNLLKPNENGCNTLDWIIDAMKYCVTITFQMIYLRNILEF